MAVDATCCRIMCIAPRKIGYLKTAETAGQTLEANARQIGEPISGVRTPFDLLPEHQSIRLG